MGTIAIVAVARTFAAYNSNLDVAVDVFTFFRVDAFAMGALLLITLSASRSHARVLRSQHIIKARNLETDTD